MTYDFEVISVPGTGSDDTLRKMLNDWGAKGYAVVAGLHVVDDELRNLLILQRPAQE